MRRNRVVVQCANCGKSIEKVPSILKLYEKHYCNRDCHVAHQKTTQLGENNPNWKPKASVKCDACGKEILREMSSVNGHKSHYCNKECQKNGTNQEVTCHWCGKVFMRQRNHAQRKQRHFCGSECHSSWLKTQTGPDAYAYKGTNVTVNCSQCGKEVIRDPSKIKRNENFFCGKSCWDEWRSVHMRDENNPNFSTPAIETNCALCGKPIRRNPWKIGTVKRTRHFCCAKHRAEWHKEHFVGENSPSWKGGTIRYYGPNWHKQKRAARKRDGYCCQVCGKSQKKNGKALDVHHIIPFRSFGYKPSENEKYLEANALTNLVSLCRNCHMRAEVGKVAIQLNLL